MFRPVRPAGRYPSGAGNGARHRRSDAPGGEAQQGGRRRCLFLRPWRQGLFRGREPAGRGYCMNAIDALFQKLRAERRKAFIPFVTAGDPDLRTTSRLVSELSCRGASLIEIGFPYSDPIADGSVIQASYTRALDRVVRVDDILPAMRGLAGCIGPLGAVDCDSIV